MIKIDELKSLCRARVSGKKMEYSNDAIDTSIRNAFMEVMGTDTFKTKRDFHRAFSKHKEEIYEIVEDSLDQYIVDSEGRKNAFFNNFVEFKTEMVGDTNEFYVDNESELVVSKLAQGNWNVLRQRVDGGHTFGVNIGYIGIAVEEEYYRFISGRCDYPLLVSKMMKAIDDYLSNLAYDTFVTALSSLPSIFQGAGAYDEDEFARLVTSVESSNGQKAFILGTKAGLRKLQAETIAETSQMSEAMKSEVNSNGFLTVWGSNVCIEIPQGFKAGKLVKSVDGKDVPDFIFNDKQVFVLTGEEKPVKMYIESPEMNRDYSYKDNMDMTFGQELVMGVGTTLAYNKLYGSWVLV